VRTIALALATLVAAAAPARADTLPLFVDPATGNPFPPGLYTPGSSFTFDLTAPGLTGFTGFNLNLIVSTDNVDPATNAIPLSVQVAFPDGFAFGPAGTLTLNEDTLPGVPQLIVNVAGAVGEGLSGVDTTSGNPAALARITVTPNADFRDNIYFSIGGYRFDANTESGTAVQTPDPVTAFPTDVVVPPATPVPGPGGFVLMGLGGLAVVARRRFARA
jgi:MYXO-CTERM domain-containing protein